MIDVQKELAKTMAALDRRDADVEKLADERKAARKQARRLALLLDEAETLIQGLFTHIRGKCHCCMEGQFACETAARAAIDEFTAKTETRPEGAPLTPPSRSIGNDERD